jgi:hypothetical protein
MTADDLVEAKLGVMGVPFQRKRPDGSPMFTRAFLGLAQVAMDGNKIVSNWYPKERSRFQTAASLPRFIGLASRRKPTTKSWLVHFPARNLSLLGRL